jgi:WD40 repeat protein
LRRLDAVPLDKAAGVFSADGKKVLTFSPDKTLCLWDAKTGKQLHKLEGHEDACIGSFSPDGKLVLSFSADDTIRLWDAGTGEELRRLIGAKGMHGTRGFVAGGRQVAAFCDDQKYRLWDTETGRIVREIDLSAAGGDRSTMTVSPDGRLALVNYADNSVRVFNMANGKEIHRYDDCRKARAFSFSSDGTHAVGGSFRAGLFVFRLPSEK